MKDEIWIAIAALEGANMHHRTDANKMANIILQIFGKRELSKHFSVEGHEVLNRLESYIYNHEY